MGARRVFQKAQTKDCASVIGLRPERAALHETTEPLFSIIQTSLSSCRDSGQRDSEVIAEVIQPMLCTVCTVR